MALLGKFFGALRSVANIVFLSLRPSPKVKDGKFEHTEKTTSDPEPVQESKANGEKKTAQEWAEYGSILAPDNSDKPIAKFKDIKLVKNENGTFIEADGTTYSLFQFSKVFGIKFGTLYGRVQKGWDIKDIINQPRVVKRDYLKAPPIKAKLWEWNGEKHTVGEWAKIYGVQKATMRIRLTTYGSPERNTDKLESYKKSRARCFEWNGETHTAKEWAAIYKVPLRTMQGRLKSHNSPEPVKRHVHEPIRKQYQWNGESHTAEEWAAKTKQSAKTVRKHFRENGTPFTTYKENKGLFKEKSYTWNGVTRRASEWADEYHCTVNAIHKRFRKNGSPEDTGGKRKAHYFTFNGETHTYKEWGEKYGISAARMYLRIKRHGSPLPIENRKPQNTLPLPKPKKDTVYVPDDESSDDELYWCDGDCKTIAEWAEAYGLSKHEVKRNFEQYGTPTKPEYDYADIAEEDDYGECEEDIDAMLQDIDKKQKNEKPKRKETISELLERIKNEPDDGRPLREILGCPRSPSILQDAIKPI